MKNLLLAHVIADELVDHTGAPSTRYARLAAFHAANDILDLPQMQAIRCALLLHLDPDDMEGSLRDMGLPDSVIEWVMS